MLCGPAAPSEAFERLPGEAVRGAESVGAPLVRLLDARPPASADCRPPAAWRLDIIGSGSRDFSSTPTLDLPLPCWIMSLPDLLSAPLPAPLPAGDTKPRPVWPLDRRLPRCSIWSRARRQRRQQLTRRSMPPTSATPPNTSGRITATCSDGGLGGGSGGFLGGGGLGGGGATANGILAVVMRVTLAEITSTPRTVDSDAGGSAVSCSAAAMEAS